MKVLTRSRAQRLLAAMRERRVLVVGDVMLDEFLWGRVARISPEAPVPVVEITSQTFRLGGAANVACNVRSLGGRAAVAGVVGRDAAGDRLRDALVIGGVEDALTLDDDGRPTTHKTRIIAHHQQVVRADREETGEIGTALEEALGDALRRAAGGAGAIILSDYQKGVVTRRLMKKVLATARREGVPLLVDPKVRHFALYRGARVTPNQGSGAGYRVRIPTPPPHEAGRRSSRPWAAGALITVAQGWLVRAGEKTVEIRHRPAGLRRDRRRRHRDRHPRPRPAAGARSPRRPCGELRGRVVWENRHRHRSPEESLAAIPA